MFDYSKEQLKKLYENLPKELQNAIFSQGTANNLYDICQRNNIADKNKTGQIIKYTGYVLMGILPPEELEQSLIKELELEEKKAKQVCWEITKFVFLPNKKSLEALYNTEIKLSENPPFPPAPSVVPAPEAESAQKTGKKDKYREPIE